MFISLGGHGGAVSRGTFVRHGIISAAFLCGYLLLSRPEIILISKLGFTSWYPAVGVVFALMLGLSPRYLPVIVLGDVLASLLIYHQPILSWSVVPAAFFGTAVYAVAAGVLQRAVKIDRALDRLDDVIRYLAVACAAAVFAAICGVTCLTLDGTITKSQMGESAVDWYIGDAVGLLSVAPFLLRILFPWVRRKLGEETESERAKRPLRLATNIDFLDVLEVTAQAITLIALLWIMFGPYAPKQYFYLAFVPIIWIAMRGGIDRAVMGLLALNFGIVVALRIAPAPPEIVTKIGLLMLVVSATGLIVGSAVSERRRVGEELGERTLFLNSLVENSPFGIVVQDVTGAVQLCNESFARLYGYKQSEVVGQNLGRLIVPANLQEQSELLTAQVNAGLDVHQNLSRIRKDSTAVEVETHAIPLIRGGQVRGAYVIYNDITLQVRATAAAAEHSRALNELVSQLQLRTNEMTLLVEMGSMLQSSSTAEDVFAVVGTSSKMLFAGSRGGALYLFKSSRNLLELVSGWGESVQREKMFAPAACWSLRRGLSHWSATEGETIRCEHLKSAAAGNYLCLPLMAQGDTLGILQVEYEVEEGAEASVTEGKRKLEHRIGMAVASQIALSLASLRLRDSLRDQSIRDPLTGLFNRRFMQECLDRELLRASRKDRALAIIFLDVDHFKRFNDTYGHEAGDEILRALGDFFRQHFRQDDVVCRYGGEEFAIILPESAGRDAAVRAERMRSAVKNLRIAHRGITLEPITVSVGIAGYPEHASTAEDLLQVADTSLYEAKAKGRDRVVMAEAK